MVYSTGRAAVDSRRRGGSVCTCWDWFQSWNQSQQVHTEPPLLLESTAARPVLYTIGAVGFVLFSWWWAWWRPKHVETPINTPYFLHLVGYLFTFMVQDARSHEIKILWLNWYWSWRYTSLPQRCCLYAKLQGVTPRKNWCFMKPTVKASVLVQYHLFWGLNISVPRRRPTSCLVCNFASFRLSCV
jgi:hypothetical protein